MTSLMSKQVRHRDENESGFTLIELLVVILIIGILSAIAIPAFLNQRLSASEASLKSDLRNAGTLLEGKGKFKGTLPADLKTSPGVTLAAMRTSDRDNKFASSQFIGGDTSNWGFHLNQADGTATASEKVFSNVADGYQSMNYRRSTLTSGQNNNAGQNVNITLPEVGKAGDKYTVGVAARHNYSGSRSLNIEFKNTKGEWPGGISKQTMNFQKDEWVYYEYTGTMTGDGTEMVFLSMFGPMTSGQYMDVTGAVIVKGDKVNSAAALSTTGYDFCVQGYHEANKTNLWRYSSLDGGLENKPC